MIVKLFLSSGLLAAFYFLFLRGRSTHRTARIFLLNILPMSLALSLARFEGVGMGVSFASLTEVPVQKVPHGTTVAVDSMDWAMIIYLGGILVLLTLNIRQLCSLKRIRRGAVGSIDDGLKVWCGAEIDAPFSAFRAIYLPAELAPQHEKIVLCHEKQHIVHRHYIDLAVMELFALAAWFVPFVWIVRRELRSVHEFEADRATMAAGVSMRDLMAAILAETAGFVPRAANPFGSITKKRFKQMKTFKNQWSTLRVAAAAPFVATLALFFAVAPATRAQTHVKATESIVTLPTPEMERKMAKFQRANERKTAAIKEKRNAVNARYQREIAELEREQQASVDKLTAKQNELIKTAKESARAAGQLKINYRAR